jgi:hypothetical protein
MEAGSPFARQLLGAFAGFKSDLEARVLCHRLPRSYMHNFVCVNMVLPACILHICNTVTSEALLGGELLLSLMRHITGTVFCLLVAFHCLIVLFSSFSNLNIV